MSATPAPPPLSAPPGEATNDPELIPFAEPLAQTALRKDDHLRLAALSESQGRGGTGLADVHLRHRALPGRDLADVDLRTDLLGRGLHAPVLISAMTGGTPGAGLLNDRLARAAQFHGVGLALGSARPLLGDPGLRETYLGPCRPPLVVANLGVAQLLQEGGLDDAVRVVDLLEADALAVHLNPLQEAVQPEGQTTFGGAADRIAELCDALGSVPVVVKEVGFGLGALDVAALADAGVAAVDVAGSGGTNWALVEGARDPEAAAVAQAFSDWGTPTADAVPAARRVAPDLEVIASGGLRDGVDGAKCLALGADAVGFARQLLLAAQEDRATEVLGVLIRQLAIATWLAGASATHALGAGHLEGRPAAIAGEPRSAPPTEVRP